MNLLKFHLSQIYVLLFNSIECSVPIDSQLIEYETSMDHQAHLRHFLHDGCLIPIKVDDISAVDL